MDQVERSVLWIRDRRVDLDTGQVRRDNEIVARLTERECSVLAFLASREGEVVSRDVLLRRIWRISPLTQTRVVDVTIRRVRAKVDGNDAETSCISTVYGEGYRLQAEAQVAATSDAYATPPGRGQTVAAVLESLRASAVVHLFGVPGVGKTTLSRAVAIAWPGEVFWCDAPSSSMDIELAVSSQLKPDDGERFALGPDLISALGRLGDALIIIDGVDAVEQPFQLLTTWRTALPALRLLVVSHHRPRIEHGEVLKLSSLDPKTSLHVLRGRDSNAAPRPWEQATIEQFDGNPLALTVLRRMRTQMDGPTLLARLQHPVNGAHERSADTLLRALRLAYEELTDEARDTLLALTVFRRGFDAHSAKEVLPPELRPGLPTHLVRLRDAGFIDIFDADIVHIPPAARAFLEAHCSTRPREAAYARLVRTIVHDSEALLSRALPMLAPQAIYELERNGEDLLHIVRTSPLADEAARAALTLHPALLLRGAFEVHEQVFKRALELLDTSQPMYASVLLAIAERERLQGATPRAIDLARLAVSAAHAAGQCSVEVRARALLAEIHLAGGSFELVSEQLQQALTCAADDPWLRARVLWVRGSANRRWRNLAAAHEDLTGALEGFGQSKDAVREMLTAQSLAYLELDHGQPARAIAWAAFGEHLVPEPAPWTEGGGYLVRGIAHFVLREDALAEQFFLHALRCFERSGVRHWQVAGNVNLAIHLLCTERASHAHEALSRAEHLAVKHMTRSQSALLHLVRAWLSASVGDFSAAQRHSADAASDQLALGNTEEALDAQLFGWLCSGGTGAAPTLDSQEPTLRNHDFRRYVMAVRAGEEPPHTLAWPAIRAAHLAVTRGAVVRRNR